MQTSVGTYYISDPLRNFKIKIKLTAAPINLNEKPFEEEYVFGWQEKLFSPREKMQYANQKEIQSELQVTYNAGADRNSVFPTKRLFSHMKNDQFIAENDLPVTGGLKSLSFPERLRRRLNPSAKVLESKSISTKPIVLDDLPQEVKYINHYSTKSTQTMCIMADLSENLTDQKSDMFEHFISDEVLLCRISVDSTGILTCTPDFTNGSSVYKIESQKHKGTYYYTIEHVSSKISEVDKQKRMKLQKELILRRNTQLTSWIGSQFEMPEEQSFRLFIVGELLYATGFEFSELYVQYYLELPFNWKTYNHKLLCGSSQIASTTYIDDREIRMFSYPLEFDLAYRPEIISDEAELNFFMWPVLFFEVLSMDFWTRSRTEGYGYIELPRTKGNHILKVNCWRPSGESVVDDLRRFFIGGTGQLEDPTYTGVPGTFEGNHLVKYGFRTRSSGELHLRLNCAVQSWSNLYKTINKCPMHGDEKQKRLALAHMDVTTIIKAYQKARSKLLETRRVIEGLGKMNL